MLYEPLHHAREIATIVLNYLLVVLAKRNKQELEIFRNGEVFARQELTVLPFARIIEEDIKQINI